MTPYFVSIPSLITHHWPYLNAYYCLEIITALITCNFKQSIVFQKLRSWPDIHYAYNE